MKCLTFPKISALATTAALLSTACGDDATVAQTADAAALDGGGIDATDPNNAEATSTHTSDETPATGTSDERPSNADGTTGDDSTLPQSTEHTTDAGTTATGETGDAQAFQPGTSVSTDAGSSGSNAAGEASSGETNAATSSDSANPASSATSGMPEGDVTSATEGDASSVPPAPVFPLVPAALALSGCTGVGPLCTVAQTGGDLTANCGGRVFTGTISETREVQLTSAPEQNAQGATVTRTCTGELSRRGKLTADCAITTSAVGETPEATETCELVSDGTFLPSVGCMEVPTQIDDVVLCVEGETSGGETIAAGSCHVVQDGCSFQAECENGLTLLGEARGSELRFTQTLTALADAQSLSGGAPAFLAGATVSHSCVGTLDGTSLSGQCGAGRSGRGGADTSVCSIVGSAVAPLECAPLAPSSELIFALDSCDPMKNGGEGEPGIGEPLCAFRQNNCIWEIQCGRDLLFTGRLQPGDTNFAWKLETGTQCEGAFSETGVFNGVCAVPDLFSCNMWSKEASPGGETCPAAPIGETVTSRGCGNANGESMACRELAWHGCDFMAICSFSYLQSVVFAGTASDHDGVGRLDLTGIGDYQCYVEAPTEEELMSDPYRMPNEWIGQCETEAGGQCRDTFNPETGEGFRGLQLFWGATEATP